MYRRRTSKGENVLLCAWRCSRTLQAPKFIAERKSGNWPPRRESKDTKSTNWQEHQTSRVRARPAAQTSLSKKITAWITEHQHYCLIGLLLLHTSRHFKNALFKALTFQANSCFIKIPLFGFCVSCLILIAFGIRCIFCMYCGLRTA